LRSASGNARLFLALPFILQACPNDPIENQMMKSKFQSISQKQTHDGNQPHFFAPPANFMNHQSNSFG
jgi:hypothetical protein